MTGPDLPYRPPFFARLLAPAGPAMPLRIRRDGADVLLVPGLYSNVVILLGPHDVAVVDTGSVLDVPLVMRSLASAGRAPEDVAFVTTTHLHFDHVMGLDRLALRLGVPIRLGRVAHDHVLAGRPLRFPMSALALWHCVSTWPMQGLPFAKPDLAKGFGFGFPGSHNAFEAPLGAPLEDLDELPGLPGWRVLATPGHADDAICLHHEESGVLVAGDTVRNFLRGEWNPLVTDAHAFAATRARLARLRVTAILPGHGPALEGTDVLRRVRITPQWMP